MQFSALKPREVLSQLLLSLKQLSERWNDLLIQVRDGIRERLEQDRIPCGTRCTLMLRQQICDALAKVEEFPELRRRRRLPRSVDDGDHREICDDPENENPDCPI